MTAAPYPEIRRWMFEAALPLWSDRGVDRAHGGFVEALDFDGNDAGLAYKRTRVACRQIYVFSHASLLGWSKGRELADAGMDYLLSRAFIPGKGFARRLTRNGEILDPTLDLYDNAFALFAFGWRLRATGDAQASAWAHRTLDLIEMHLAHPSAEGFWHETPPKGRRQQNPHMHLVEALLVLYEASGEDRFAALARSIVDLLHRRFLNAAKGTLCEFFEDDWSPAPGEEGRVTEPGHQFEWAWILVNARRLLKLDLERPIRSLIAFGERHGVDPVSGAAFNQVREDGVALDRGSRTWPNTERIKAAVALWELDGTDPDPAIAQSTRLLLDRYLAAPFPGAWIDAFDGDGRPVAPNVPASTLYHVFLAFAEALRVSEARTG
jgi:N-acylglucosamine 2-epimerase/mannose-6-phosphate isomerase